MGVAVDEVVDIRLDAHALQTVAELVGGTLTVVVGDDDGAHHEVAAHKLVAQTEHVLVVGDAQIGTHLVLLNIVGTHHDDNLQLVAQLSEHPQLRVGLETGEHTRGVMVVEELAAQLQIELAVELGDALADMF